MVSPTYYPDGRRYSRLDPTYVYPERQQRHSHSSDARTSTMTEREPETDAPPRKRIAVACGRCRKRKIRCSGDSGNGLPCQNCKAAGAESCMFLRVASTEAPWVQPSDQAFSYELKAARAYHAHNALASPMTTSPPHYASDIHDGMSRYPSNSASYPSYGTGKYYSSTTIPTTSWSAAGYSDDGTAGVDYSAAAMGYSYPYHSQDPGYLYRMAAANSKAAVTPSAGDLYGNTEAAGYGYGSSGAALVHRPATAATTTTEAPNFSLSNVAASLPHAGGGDRLLPSPAPRIPAANTNIFAYRADGGQQSSYTASSSTKSSGSPASQTSPTSAVSEVTTSYTTVGGPSSYESSPVAAYPPPLHTLPSMALLPHRLSNTDMAGYPASTSSSADSIFSASDSSLRTHGSASDLSYKYTDSASSAGRRGSGETSSSNGSLSNGQQYTVTTPATAVGMYAAAVTGHHGRNHLGAYMLSDEVDQSHHHHHQQQRRSAGGLSAS
ncbi:putative transcriptional regulatory protein C2H10.01 [Colletotrichum chlorophyti]|uniref:Putative transcriptional regulatory protein C2H10.01 n=1 Tax=Colletotrichum chlorophyti TaxID=708187 RepID=A0A1Q8RSC2_9PEZI|nr:putative transcriptional regulatory protein C2H10.01 [Colletotrichum chlorophyti]